MLMQRNPKEAKETLKKELLGIRQIQKSLLELPRLRRQLKNTTFSSSGTAESKKLSTKSVNPKTWSLLLYYY